MAYSGPGDVEGLYPKALTSGLKGEEVNVFIELSDAEIDAIIGVRYTTPVALTPATTPSILRKLSAVGALLMIIDRNPGSAPDWIVRLGEWRAKLLEAIAAGTAALPAGQLADSQLIGSNTTDYVPIFGAQPSLHERVDPQRVEDEADARVP